MSKMSIINTIYKSVVIATLLLLGVTSNAQITVRIDSLKYSNVVIQYHLDFYDSPPIEAFFTLENHSGKDILAFTAGDPDRFNVRLCLQMQFEYDGKQYKSPSIDIDMWAAQLFVSEINYNYKGAVCDALILHDGESVGGWDCLFYPFEDMLKKFKDPDNQAAEYKRLRNLIPEILPAATEITIETHRVEQVWRKESYSFETYELTEEQCCCPDHCQCPERE